jgi:hypothetical protein
LPAETAAKQLKVSKRSVETAKAVKKADPALAEEVKQGKTKLSTAVRKTAALKALPKVATAKKDPSKIEQKRHDERMKSARYKLEQFVQAFQLAHDQIWRGRRAASPGVCR